MKDTAYNPIFTNVLDTSDFMKVNLSIIKNAIDKNIVMYLIQHENIN